MILICKNCGTGYCPISGEIPDQCEYCKGKLVEQDEESEEDKEEDEK